MILEIKNVDSLAFKEGWIVDGEDVQAPPHIGHCRLYRPECWLQSVHVWLIRHVVQVVVIDEIRHMLVAEQRLLQTVQQACRIRGSIVVLVSSCVIVQRCADVVLPC